MKKKGKENRKERDFGMHQKTINGVEVTIVNLGPRGYLVLADGGESFITKHKPQTDQEIMMLQQELMRTREEIALLSQYMF